MRKTDLADLDWWAIYTLRSAGHSQREVAGWLGVSSRTLYRWLDPAGDDKRRQYLEANREQLLEYHKQYYEANREQRLEYRKQYYEANRERLLEYQRKHYEGNREQILEQRKQYREANREQIREQQRQARRDRRRWQCLTSEQFDEQLKKQGGRCNGCLWKTRPRQLTEDHIVPKSRGGTDDPEGLQLLCHPCNSGKGTRPMSALIADLEADEEICPTAPPRWEPEGGWPE